MKLSKIQPAIFLMAVATVFAALDFGCYRHAPAPAVEIKMRAVRDDLGRTIQIPEKVERVVSLAPSLTEMIFAVGAGDKLVGVTKFCNYPPEAEQIQKVSDTQTPNIENIIALKPEVVFVSTASQLETFTKMLESQNIAVFVTRPDGLENIYKSIATVGDILGTSERADEVVKEMRKRVARVEELTRGAKRPKVFVQIDKNSLYTVGKDSFITDIIARAGGVSATADLPTAYPKLSKETALALNPEVIILSESSDNREPNEVFRNSPAVKNKRVYSINADLLSRPGPRIVDALEQISEKLEQVKIAVN